MSQLSNIGQTSCHSRAHSEQLSPRVSSLPIAEAGSLLFSFLFFRLPAQVLEKERRQSQHTHLQPMPLHESGAVETWFSPQLLFIVPWRRKERKNPEHHTSSTASTRVIHACPSTLCASAKSRPTLLARTFFTWQCHRECMLKFKNIQQRRKTEARPTQKSNPTFQLQHELRESEFPLRKMKMWKHIFLSTTHRPPETAALENNTLPLAPSEARTSFWRHEAPSLYQPSLSIFSMVSRLQAKRAAMTKRDRSEQ